MSDEAAFLRAIAESPDDDAPRLVFADWLDEHGEPARAELIRVQCAAEAWPEDHPERERLRQRAGELLLEHQARWEAGFVKLPTGTEYRRGFLDSIKINDADWVRRLPSLVAIQPPVRITLSQARTATAESVGRMPELTDVRRLAIGSPRSEQPSPLVALLQSPYLSRLTELDITSVFADDGTAPRLLAGWPGLTSVHTLRIRPDHIRTVLASPHLQSLRSLDVSGLGLVDLDLIHSLLDWPGLGQLRKLRVWNLDDRALRTLADSGRATGLRHLAVSSEQLRVDGCLAALASPGLPALRDVSLKRVFAMPPPLGTLPAVTDGEPLTRLELGNLLLGNAGVTWLAGWPGLSGLRKLSLRECGIGTNGVKALAASPYLNRATVVRLSVANVSDVAIQRLRDRLDAPIEV